MLEIAIIEDLLDSAQALMKFLIHYQKEMEENVSLQHFLDGESFIENCQNKKYDIVFLDIGLPRKNGMTIAREFREIDQNATIIFLTVLSQYAIEGYDVNAYCYMIKPISESLLKAKLDLLLERRKDRLTYIFLMDEDGVNVKVPLEKISYIESVGHYCYFYTEDGVYKKRISIRQLEGQFEKNGFAKASGAFLINFHHLTGWTHSYLMIDNKNKISIGRRLKANFFKLLSQWQEH